MELMAAKKHEWIDEPGDFLRGRCSCGWPWRHTTRRAWKAHRWDMERSEYIAELEAALERATNLLERVPERAFRDGPITPHGDDQTTLGEVEFRADVREFRDLLRRSKR